MTSKTYSTLKIREMGIKDINKLIRRHTTDAFFTLPIHHLSNKRIAVDSNNWMYTNMAVARKKVINKTDIATEEPNQVEIRREWFLAAFNFIIGWLSYNITPIFVFDGVHPPEKAETKAKRHAIHIAARAKIDALYKQLNSDILERPAGIIDDLRKELRNYNYIPPEDFELFKMIIRGIGIPCLQAVGDGERLCSMLCVEGKVAAVFSDDTDNLVYGCPLTITGFSEAYTFDENGHRIAHLDCVRVDKALEGLKINHSTFVDLCIMSGCDYNTNMPGYAAIKSLALLQKHGSIDDLPRNFNTECLRHARCRELFKYVPSTSIITKMYDLDPEGLNLDVNKEAMATARDYLEMAGVSGQINRILAAYQVVTPAQDGHAEGMIFTPVPRYAPPPPRVLLTINKPPPKLLTLCVIK